MGLPGTWGSASGQYCQAFKLGSGCSCGTPRTPLPGTLQCRQHLPAARASRHCSHLLRTGSPWVCRASFRSIPAPGPQLTWRSLQPPTPSSSPPQPPRPCGEALEPHLVPVFALRPSWLLSALSPRLLSVAQGPQVSDPAPPPLPWGGQTLTLLRAFPQEPPLRGRSPQSRCWRQGDCDR